MHVVALAGNHGQVESLSKQNSLPAWPWLASPYLLCPANTSPHKNHEVLLEGYARAALDRPLVLTGIGSDFADPMPLGYRILRHAAVLAHIRAPKRGRALLQLLRRLGLKSGADVIALGYLSDDQYYCVLGHAACIIMPTLGEGGGSFPVEEGLIRGVPVICSDIPIMREHMERIGAEVAWFDPLRADALAAQMLEICRDYPARRQSAMTQRDRLCLRAWGDVAADYLAIMLEGRS